MRINGRWAGMVTMVALVTVAVAGAGPSTASAEPPNVAVEPGVSTNRGVLSVSISGPSTVRPNTFCTFVAVVSGGTGSYTYTWAHTAGTGVGAGNELTVKSLSAYTITVDVIDSNGDTGTATRSISVSSSAPHCPI